MEKCVKLGVIGLGQRGSGMISTPLLPFAERGEVAIVAVCDPLSDRVKAAADKIEEAGQPRPFETSDYREVLARADVDAVFVAVSWEAHVEVAVAAMLAGKPIGLEAGGAYSLEDCYRLVQVYEQTGTELMFMENCCYGKRELMALNMVRRGVLGHVMHCNGAYSHDLREEILGGKENRHYRLRNYIHRNGENYPTHEIGPIAKLLDINNGNRFISLSSFASASRGLHEYAVEKKGAEHPLSNVDFAQGDVVTTVLTCSGGQTVTLTLNTTLPHAYSRRFEVHGTKGMYMEDNDSLFLDNCEEHKKKRVGLASAVGQCRFLRKRISAPALGRRRRKRRARRYRPPCVRRISRNRSDGGSCAYRRLRCRNVYVYNDIERKLDSLRRRSAAVPRFYKRKMDDAFGYFGQRLHS